jgi:hypothetical protein
MFAGRGGSRLRGKPREIIMSQHPSAAGAKSEGEQTTTTDHRESTLSKTIGRRFGGAKRRTTIAGAAIAASVLGLSATASAGPDPAHSGPSRDDTTVEPLAFANGRLTAAERTVIRASTAHYRNVERALAAGYAPVGECTADPELGGMGVHYANMALVMDGIIDPTVPEILVYEPQAHGRPELVAIEYMQVDDDQDLETALDRPTLFGEPFDGPMLGHGPGEPIHYDLHAWVWKRNPAGVVAQFNPRVSCDDASTEGHDHG